MAGTALALSQTRSTCSEVRRAPLVITRDAVGGLPFDATLDSLRHLCPAARDTMISNSGGHAYPGLSFSTEGTVVVMQYSNATAKVAGDRPGDGWMIRGPATLPTGVSLDANWRTLATSFGAHQTSLGVVLVVRFCQLPRFLFTLEVDASSLRMLADGRVDESTIPASALVHHITILSGSLVNALSPC
jgi:hypothetical protein